MKDEVPCAAGTVILCSSSSAKLGIKELARILLAARDRAAVSRALEGICRKACKSIASMYVH